MKNSLRKVMALLLAAIMVIGCFAGCSKTEQTKDAPDPGTSTEKPATEKKEDKKEDKQEDKKETETSAPAEEVKAIQHPVTTDPITIDILTWRHSTATNDADDIWIFRYLEYWLHEEYGYNVTINVTQTNEPDQQISLAFGTDNLPDLIWGIELTPTQAVSFGQGQGMILDWAPYINDTVMPNLYEALQSNPNALAASTCGNGAVYCVPVVGVRKWNTASSSLGASQDRMFINTAWLDQLGLKMPTNWDEYVEMLRKFKTEIKLPDGQEVIPLVGNTDSAMASLEKALWTMLGFYGSELSKYGTQFAIKDEKVVLPVYTEDYKTFVTCMNQLWTEGLLNQGHYENDVTTVRGLMKAGLCGAVSDSTMANMANYLEWECMPWFPLSDSELHISTGKGYSTGNIWASAETEYPEILALIIDYMNSYEGCVYFAYGPMQGQDPLNMVDGWYYDEKGKLTTKMVADGTYDNFTSWCYQYIFSRDTVRRTDYAGVVSMEMAGLEPNYPTYTFTDSVTGEELIAEERTVYTDATAQGHWFLSNSAVSRPYITAVNLPNVYMSEDDALDAADLRTTLEFHITAETAKFITGARPLSEVEAFQKELKDMGIERFIDMHVQAYEPYMSSVFGK